MEQADLSELAARGVPVELDMGDRQKVYEAETESRLDPSRATIARVDGRGFSRFTTGLEKPDMRFVECMMAATRHLIEGTHAALGYTQSDEISLVFRPHTEDSTPLFDGRVQKLTSVIASMATAAFTRALLVSEIASYADKVPLFDCRVYQVPTEGEAANALLWRVRDATKNATSMAAQNHFSPSALHAKSSEERRAMLREKGVEFEAFPDAFRNGSFWRRAVVERTLTEAEIAAIPEIHRPSVDHMVLRSEVQRIAMPDHIRYSDIEPHVL